MSYRKSEKHGTRCQRHTQGVRLPTSAQSHNPCPPSCSFLRAFTDRPQAVASGFNKVERIMKSLFLKRLYLWPRFQMQVSSALEASPPEVVDIRMPLSPAMVAIQEAIIQVGFLCPQFSDVSTHYRGPELFIVPVRHADDSMHIFSL